MQAKAERIRLEEEAASLARNAPHLRKIKVGFSLKMKKADFIKIAGRPMTEQEEKASAAWINRLNSHMRKVIAAGGCSDTLIV